MGTKPSDALEIMAGGLHLSVPRRDGGEELVFVRELPIAEMTRYQALMDDEDASLRLYLGEKADLAKELTRDAQVAIIKKGEELNLSFFAEWLQRRIRRQSDVAGLALQSISDERLRGIIAQAAGTLAQPQSDSENSSRNSAA